MNTPLTPPVPPSQPTQPVQPQRPVFQDPQAASLSQAQAPVQHGLPPGLALQRFLVQNNMQLRATIMNPDTVSFVGDGFVLTDKPLIKVEPYYVD